MAARTYRETVEYLYRLLPDQQRTGTTSAKVDLRKTLILLEALGNPHERLRCVHVAGTNGKGTVSHLLASFGTASGLRTGLYTSPHYVDFRERIRLDGELVPEEWVVAFVAEHETLIERTGASFFEFTVAMAFSYFAEVGVDLAVIEVGLGGRLDSTNVIPAPSLLAAVITNIGLDHTDVLGETHTAIAREKAGIIKTARPVVIGEYRDDTLRVFREVAAPRDAPVLLAEEQIRAYALGSAVSVYDLGVYPRGAASPGQEESVEDVLSDVQGPFRVLNIRTAVAAWTVVGPQLGFPRLPPARGLAAPGRLSGYRGRFQVLSERPLVLADAGHNAEAWAQLGGYVGSLAGERPLLIVCGFVRGKDYAAFFRSFSAEAFFFVGAPDLPRAVPATQVCREVTSFVRHASPHGSVGAAYEAALRAANPTDVIFVGGSTFVVGALFEHLGIG